MITQAKYLQAKRVCTKRPVIRKHGNEPVCKSDYDWCDTTAFESDLAQLNEWLEDSDPAWDLCMSCAAIYGKAW